MLYGKSIYILHNIFLISNIKCIFNLFQIPIQMLTMYVFVELARFEELLTRQGH